MIVAALGLWLAASPVSSSPPDPGLRGPLGILDGVLVGEREVERPGARLRPLPGCPQRAIDLQRLRAVAAGAAAQVERYLESPTAPSAVARRSSAERAFLTEAIARVRAATGLGQACPGEKLDKAPERVCGKDGDHETFLFVVPRSESGSAQRASPDAGVAAGPKPGVTPEVAGVVHLETQGEACSPGLSVVLYDDHGRPRFRYHAPFGSAPSAEAIGERCKSVELTLGPDQVTYLAVRKVGRCR